MSVAVALAENLHHSRQKVEGGAHEGPRAQKTVRATGARPGVLTEPEPQGRTVTDGYVAVPVPSLAVPLLAGAAGEAVDSSSLGYLTAAALRQREEEERQKELEEREEAKKRADEMQSLLAVPRALRTPAQLRRFQELAAQSSDSWASLRRRERKKRRKKKPSKSSSSSGHARRRLRQWHARFAGLPGVPFSRCVPFGCRQVCDARHHGRYEPEGQHHARRQSWQWHVQWLYWVRCTLRYVPFWRRQAQDAPHHGRYGPEGQLQWYGKAGIAGDSVPRAVFPSLSSGPRCLASWPVWSMWPFSACARLGLLVSDDVPRAVLLLVVSGPRCPSPCLA